MSTDIKKSNDKSIISSKSFSVLAFDLGNSRLKCSYFEDSCMKHYGVFKLNEIFFEGRLNYYVLDNWLEENRIDRTTRCFISSVNLLLIKHIKSFLESRSFSAQIIEPKDLRSIIRIEYDISMIGVDRLLHSIGASLFYEGSVCVVDMGTAITIDLVKNNVYKGGYILPGVESICKSLTFSLPQLPLVDIDKNHENVPAKNTSDALSNGVFYSITYGLQGIVRSWQEKFDEFTVVLTGGSARLFESELSWPYFPHLTLWGIYKYAEGGDFCFDKLH